MKFSVALNEKESILLLDYMKENNIKSKAEAIRKCLRTAVSIEAKYDMLKDIDSKLNRIIYRENIQKKLLEQFYASSTTAASATLRLRWCCPCWKATCSRS